MIMVLIFVLNWILMSEEMLDWMDELLESLLGWLDDHDLDGLLEWPL